MFCPNCGKQVNDNDNFCRYCGFDIKSDIILTEPLQDISYTNTSNKLKKEIQSVEDETITENQEIKYQGEELVLYDIKKHWMALFWPIVLIPVFFLYFWNIFLNTHSIISWVIMFTILVAVIYPILRYVYDKTIITTKFVRIRIGVLNPIEINIPMKDIDRLDVTQTVMGSILGYGMFSFNENSKKYEYRYIQTPEDLQYIIDNPDRFINESLEEDESI